MENFCLQHKRYNCNLKITLATTRHQQEFFLLGIIRRRERERGRKYFAHEFTLAEAMANERLVVKRRQHAKTHSIKSQISHFSFDTAAKRREKAREGGGRERDELFPDIKNSHRVLLEEFTLGKQKRGM